MPPEAPVLRKLRRFLKEHGWYAVRVVQAGRAGTPDLIACIDGYFYAFETKATRGKLSDLQKVHHREIERARGTFRVITPENIDSWITHTTLVHNKPTNHPKRKYA